MVVKTPLIVKIPPLSPGSAGLKDSQRVVQLPLGIDPLYLIDVRSFERIDCRMVFPEILKNVRQIILLLDIVRCDMV